MLETFLRPGETNERCGLILKDGTIIEVENVAADKTLGYQMSPLSVLPFVEEGLVAGTWHTHPDTDPNLSGEDYSGFLGWPDLEHSIVGWRNGKATVLRYRVEDGLVIACD
jgi:proteasome lid subunit RPN8/RPN11